MSEAVLDVRALSVVYATQHGSVQALDEANLRIGTNEIVGIVGESGSGKSTLAAAVGGLLPRTASRTCGDIFFDGQSIFGERRDRLMRDIRRHTVGFVFQGPIASLDPTKRVRKQLQLATGASSDELAELLQRVNVGDVRRVLDSYPHELSGGLAQRVGIAMAIARRPRILIADEPTASLDASVREHVMSLLTEVVPTMGMSLLIFTHDLRSVARHCERTVIMYGGRVVEAGVTADVLGSPIHPYTRALLLSAPGVEEAGGRLAPIVGTPPVLNQPCPGCAFAPRCAFAVSVCTTTRPTENTAAGRMALCHRTAEILEVDCKD